MMLNDHPCQRAYNRFRRLCKVGLLLINRFSSRGSENVPATGG